jgi:predicted kinase
MPSAAAWRFLGTELRTSHILECRFELVLLDEQPTPFDGIEFNPALRWIDVMSEIAFTVMDLLHFQRADLAWRFLNGWLEATGDYAGMSLLRFYIAYRAMVRAKVGAIRAAQPGIASADAAEAWSGCRGYLQLAADCWAGIQPALIITHGLPGSGKSTFAQIAQERLQAIRLRSDVERKRLFGLSPLADSHASTGIDLYSAEITQRTYASLRELARELLLAGYRVIVDAAFLDRDEREQFQRLAHELSLPFVIASMQAGDETLRERIMQRQRAANDASEADIAVLEKLEIAHHPLSADERNVAANFANQRAGIAADSAGWSRLQQLLVRD